MELVRIKQLACSEFGKSFTKRSRIRPLVYRRAVYFKLCRDHTNKSLDEIGKTLGYDHATVLHALNLFKKFELWEESVMLRAHKKINDKILKETHNRFATSSLLASRLLHDKINLKHQMAQLKYNVEKNS